MIDERDYLDEADDLFAGPLIFALTGEPRPPVTWVPRPPSMPSPWAAAATAGGAHASPADSQEQ